MHGDAIIVLPTSYRHCTVEMFLCRVAISSVSGEPTSSERGPVAAAIEQLELYSSLTLFHCVWRNSTTKLTHCRGTDLRPPVNRYVGGLPGLGLSTITDRLVPPQPPFVLNIPLVPWSGHQLGFVFEYEVVLS